MMSRLAGVLVALGGLIPLFSTRYSPISFFNPHEQAFGIRADKDRDTFDLDRVDRELQLKRAKGKGKSNSSIKPWWEQPTRKGVNFQPQVTVVESAPETKSFGSLSLPYGSKWCDGKPTYWMIGHQKDDEEPLCEVEPGKWERLGKAILDVNDKLNAEDSNAIDRHDCVTMDVNHDGAEDIICGVGANKGTGYGYNELYLTQDDGTLKKIPSGHGLQEYNTMRNRLSTTLKGLDGVEYVFFATKGVARRDGRDNVHRMFQNVYESEEIMPYFKEVKGPWRNLFQASCAVAADINSDKRDDLIVCDQFGTALISKQTVRNDFVKVPIPLNTYTKNWRNVRVADVTGDGLKDLVVVYFGNKKKPAYLRIFNGIDSKPFFNLEEPWYELILPFAAPDLEILDVNRDKINDIYVIQVDEEEGYCGPGKANRWWGNSVQPRTNWVAPKDEAHDILLFGTPDKSDPFDKIFMEHSYPGCGNISERFGSKRQMILTQGNSGHAGPNLLLSWL